ncbi:chitinase [Catenulispora sp. GAS73]|uniref:fibronectin type III domain-containing protein n=1 Tax=Catenulispora sp. GAS73 TaxID=3156269 RepID=UPI00351639A7
MLAAVLIAATMSVALSASRARADSNLVVNSGFETGSLSPWTCDAGTGSVVSSPVHSGSHALAGAANNSDDAQCTQTIAVQPNSAYTLSAYVQGAYVYLGATDYSSTWTPSATSYQQLSTSFTTGASTTSVQIYLHGWYAQGTYYADDVSLVGPGGQTQVPPVPTGLAVSGTTSSSVSLSWSASSGATGYNVYRGGSKVASVSGTSYTDSGLSASTSYSYTVTATNSAGESAQSGAVTGTTTGGGPSVPPTPSGLSVSGTTSSSVSLSWSASSGATGYNVYRGGSKVGSVSGTSYTDSGLSPSTTYSYAVSATNSAGESAKSSAVSATTAGSGGGNGSLPKHVLTGYWHDFVNAAQPLSLAAVPAGYNLVAVAFANADPSNPGGVTFSVDSGLSSALGGYTDAQFKADIATLHSRGQKVIISVGGQNGAISVADSTSANNFANSVYGIMQSYGFDGVDIDLENGVNATYMAQALQSLSSKVGSGLIITMAPQTIDMQSTGMAYFQLALNIKNILTIVNMQYYNSGTMNGCDQGVYAEGTENFLTELACIQLQNGLRPDQVGLGLPASGSAAGGGYVAPSVVNNALDCLAAGTSCGSYVPPTKWPTIRGAMTWSINWDASNGWSFVNTVAPHLAAMP